MMIENLQNETRLERGRRALSQIDGQAGQNVIDALADIAPDFATFAARPRNRHHRGASCNGHGAAAT
jgi:hypothetical protein